MDETYQDKIKKLYGQRDAEIIRLRTVEKKSLREIARIIGIDYATVKQVLNKNGINTGKE